MLSCNSTDANIQIYLLNFSKPTLMTCLKLISHEQSTNRMCTKRTVISIWKHDDFEEWHFSQSLANNIHFRCVCSSVHSYPSKHTNTFWCRRGCVWNEINPNGKSSLVMNRTVALEHRNNLYGAIRMCVQCECVCVSISLFSKIVFTFGWSKLDNGYIQPNKSAERKRKSCAKLYQLEIEIVIVVIMNGSVNLSIAKF